MYSGLLGASREPLANEIAAMAFTAEKIDYLDSRAGTEALRARHEQSGDRSGAARATPPVARKQVPKARLGRTALAGGPTVSYEADDDPVLILPGGTFVIPSDASIRHRDAGA